MKHLPVLLAAALAQSALGDSTIGLNFCDNWPAPRVSDGTADGFAGWTDSRAEGDTTNGAVQTAPLPLGSSGATVTWTAANTWSAGSESTNEQALYRVYLDDGQTSAGVGVRVTISGLADWLTATGNTSYKLRCYANNDAANTFQPVSVWDGLTAGSTELQSIPITARGNGDYPTGGSLSTGESRGYGDSSAPLTANIITLTIPPRSGSIRGTLCAVKITASGADVAALNATFASAATVPLSTAGYTATGKTVNLAVGFAPPAGVTLTVVENTGLAFIQGEFSNLAQGQTVNLSYQGTVYPFVANYFGGTGNDLVLQWAGVRLLAWGSNSYGQLGTSRSSDSWIPTGVDQTGVLAGKTVTAFSGSLRGSLALCADGTLAAWGYNYTGNLGNGTTTNSIAPVAVDRSGVLAGKTVIAISTGPYHSVVLGADGTVATWGWNTSAELGSGSSANTTVPVLVVRTGALLGKSVVAVAAGATHCLALCSDGKMVTWGSNYGGQLGIGSYTTTGITTSNVPVAVNTAGVLAGKTVMAISAGYDFNLALCSDGSVVGWGTNGSGQLGNNSTSNSPLPVLTDRTGVLAGKSVTAISAGSYHSLALCADGTLASWGANTRGELGNPVATKSIVPVLVDRSGVLAGKTVVGISGGRTSSMARCADGTIATWGENQVGQLGDNSAVNSSVPVRVDTSELRGTEKFISGSFGSAASHGLALMSAPPAPVVTTLAAADVTDTGATLRGTINGNGSATTVTFEYGLTTAYGAIATATPGAVTGTATTEVTATLANLQSNATYHYRLVAASAGGTVKGGDMTFTTSGFAALSGLSLGSGSLVPAFTSTLREYGAVVPSGTDRITVTPVAAALTATLTVNGTAVSSGGTSAPLPLAYGPNPVLITVTAAGGINTQTYVVTVTRLPAMLRFESTATIPITVPELTATGSRIALELGFAPPTGTALTVVDNAGLKPIQGTFDGLAQGQRVVLGFGGISYEYVANYFGGTGNDLVLQWARNRLVGWGKGAGLGNGLVDSVVPAAVEMTGVLAGKTVIGAAAGQAHSLVVCADGTVAAWGSNLNGRLGDGTTTDRSVPVLVNRTGVLAGKTVIAVAAGARHSLALCSDGTLAAWGGNNNAQLGISSTADSSVPVLVNRTGVLAGRTVTAIAAGDSFNLALCADGRVAAWGFGFYGELGNGASVMNSWQPVLVAQSGELAGRRVSAIAAGSGHGLALCTDGTLVAWGNGQSGQLGNNQSDTNSLVPSLVDRGGALAGRRVLAISAGGYYSNLLCADGVVTWWGGIDNKAPTVVPLGSVLQGRSVTRVAAGNGHRLASCADGTVAAWGFNSNAQLGNGTKTTVELAPVLVGPGVIRAEERLVAVASGSMALHNLAWVAAPAAPAATTLAATAVLPTSATLQGQVNAGGGSVVVTFEYGLTSGYGTTVAGSHAPVGGTVPTAVGAAITGLSAGAVYHFRVVATGPDGAAYGADQTFTASNPPAFGGYSIATPWQTASNIPLPKLLAKVSDPDGDAVIVTTAGPTSAHGGAVTLSAGAIRYIPPNAFSGVDTFALTLADSGGASISGTVTVTVGPAPSAGGVGVNPPVLTVLPDGKMGLAFHGIPGRSYIVQRSVSGLENWVTLATVVADANGKVFYTDEFPPAGSAFYRLGPP